MRASLLFIFLFFIKALQGQPHLFKTFSTHEGLSNNNVTCFVKDKQGFLWVGTQNGLNRFDGNAFDHFYNNPGDSNSIASNEIQTLYRDSKDRIWIGTAAGISVLEPGQKKFLNYAPDTLVLPRIGQFFAAIQEDHQGKIWTGCSYDLLIFDPLTQTFASSGWMRFAATVKPAKGNHTRIAVISIQPKSTDEFWVLTTYGLFSVHTGSRQFRYYPCDLSDDFYGSSISYIDPAGKLWIGTYDHDIISFDPVKNEWQQINIPASLRDERGLHIAYGIQPYHNDTLIFCSDKKLLLYHPASSTFSLFKQDGNKNIPDTYFFQIMRDGQHYWMAATSGLVSMQEKKTVFTYHTTPGLTQTYRVFNRPGFPQVYMGNFADRIVNINTITGQATPLLLGNKPVREGLRYYTSYNTDTGFISTGDHLYLLQQQKMSLHEITLPPKNFPTMTIPSGIWLQTAKGLHGSA
ncbi:MAG: hypothetical protein IPP73_01070 [Chitinophagaceae bacterium]|nr:hypothetical protein [Chitinophagaceae bacterium]